jgi:hypothetical protein
MKHARNLHMIGSHATGLPVPPVDDQPDRRDGVRHLTTFRIAKVRIGDAETLGIVRNISSGGMKIDLIGAVEPGSDVVISLGEDHEVTAHIVWRHDSATGVQFTNEIDLQHMLAKTPLRQGRKIARPPRVQVQTPATIWYDGDSIKTEICDLSQHGAKLLVDHALKINDDITLQIADLGPIRCTIKWQSDGHAGVLFHSIFPLKYLMNWLARQI